MDDGALAVGVIVAGIGGVLVFIDAAMNEIPLQPDGPVKYSIGDAFGWGLVTFLILILGLPYYLVTRARVLRRRRPHEVSGIAPPVVQQVEMTPRYGTADEIQKYKRLLDEGAITEEEFMIAKQKLLT